MSKDRTSFEELVRIVKVLNNELDPLPTDKFLRGDAIQATLGNLCAIRRVRVTLQYLRLDLLLKARKEMQKYKEIY